MQILIHGQSLNSDSKAVHIVDLERSRGCQTTKVTPIIEANQENWITVYHTAVVKSCKVLLDTVLFHGAPDC
jgi:hypothetical protein